MDIHINGYDVIVAVGALVFSLLAWAAAALGGVYIAAKMNPMRSFIFSYVFVATMIVLAMYAGSVR